MIVLRARRTFPLSQVTISRLAQFVPVAPRIVVEFFAALVHKFRRFQITKFVVAALIGTRFARPGSTIAISRLTHVVITGLTPTAVGEFLPALVLEFGCDQVTEGIAVTIGIGRTWFAPCRTDVAIPGSTDIVRVTPSIVGKFITTNIHEFWCLRIAEPPLRTMIR